MAQANKRQDIPMSMEEGVQRGHSEIQTEGLIFSGGKNLYISTSLNERVETLLVLKLMNDRYYYEVYTVIYPCYTSFLAP